MQLPRSVRPLKGIRVHASPGSEGVSPSRIDESGTLAIPDDVLYPKSEHLLKVVHCEGDRVWTY